MRILRRLAYLARYRHRARDLEEELAFHRAMAGSRVMGNETLAREDARAVWVLRWIDEAWQDARYAVRSLSRQPAFAAAAIAIVALGAGAATSVFGLLDALVMRSLPVERPDRLVWFRDPAFSYPIYREVRTRMTVLDGVFGWSMDRTFVDWTGRQGELQPSAVLEVTDGFFSTLRLHPILGRGFDPEDAATAVITHAAWTRQFGADPSAIGRPILVGGRPFTIVGVTPRGFSGVAPGVAPDVIVPIAGRYGPGDSVFTTTTTSWLHLMGRVKDGVSRQQAQAALQTIWPRVLDATTNPGMPADRRARYLTRATALEPGRSGYSTVRQRFADPLWLLMGLAGLLVAIACASVANLLHARGVARRREVAVRLAIGAGRGRVVRQMIVESLVLTLAGAGLGLMLAWWADGVLVSLMQTSVEHIALDTTPGWRTLGFGVLLAVLVSGVSAALPAVHASRADVSSGLKDAGSGDRRFGWRWSPGKALVAIQVALAVVLLAGAAVFSGSLARVLSQDPGLDAAAVLVVSADAAAAGYKGPAQRAFHLQLLDGLRQAPSVESAALSWMPPISASMGNWTQSIGIDGGPLMKDAPFVYFNGISPGYFATVGIGLRRGRDLADTDSESAPKVVVINESLGRQFFPEQDPLGRRISVGRAASRKDLLIVGVVQDTKYGRLQEPRRNIAYLSIAQVEDVTSGRDLFAEVRAVNLAAAAADARQIVRTLDRRVPVRIESVADRIRESTLTERLMAGLAGGLGITALALACAGVYGLFAYTVARHRREIGIRLALGASRSAVLWMVQRESIVLALTGVGLGLAAAVALARFVSSALLFEISAADPVALGAAGGIALLVAAAAAYLPARRAASVDPAAAIKAER